jgi:hypothetical protein
MLHIATRLIDSRVGTSTGRLPLVDGIKNMLGRPATRTDRYDLTGPIHARWRNASQLVGWPDAEDWWTPAVDALVESLTGSDADPVAAAERLGKERALNSVRLADALVDLNIGLDVMRISGRSRAQLAGALASGWADGLAGWLGRTGLGCLDTLTDLATRDYLSTRLRELYAESSAEGSTVIDKRVLVVVEVRTATSQLITEHRMVRLGQVLGSVFTRGQTLARIAPGIAVALAHRDETLGDLLVALQLELSWSGLGAQPASARTWLEPLPPDYFYLADLLEDISRP